MVNDLPAVKSAWEDSSLQHDEYLKAFYIQLNHVIPTPKIPEWEQIVFSKLQNYIEIAARGTMTTEDALKALDREVNQVLGKRRWLERIEGEYLNNGMLNVKDVGMLNNGIMECWNIGY
jgi:multiple sugar transport system substrate-binding protein